MLPTLAKVPPVGPEWLHEVKFDGWRCQVHVNSVDVRFYSKRGSDLTSRFKALKPALADLRSRKCVIDAELIACDGSGFPSFRRLMKEGGKAPLCLWCFDLLAIDGASITTLPIEERKALLDELISTTDSKHLQFSGDFEDAQRLLETCRKMGLEGIMSKRKGSAYRSGPTGDWVKVKTAIWRESNRKRWEDFS